ncbi:hypothetical protein L6164_012401 [Bauhinia variegata]|uniref:Uncharacterized protein n=1 Tax=Bauhinia variegata TaxID=167791 RepID=A0ACB9P9F8_BAUVA|nr:hypothetical protein L6164_012401 [Bauhinia variegata]
MEELKKLEQVQSMLEYMESRGIVNSSTDSDHHSNRFLANLLLFMIHPSGTLNMEKKCCLVSELVPKLSGAFLEEACLWLNQDGLMNQENSGCQQNLVENALQLSCDLVEDCSLSQSNNYNVAMVELDSMEQANSTLDDFCRSYFMFHGLDINRAQSIFKYLPVLSFTESFIYQLDRINEKLLQAPTDRTSVLGGKNEKATQTLVSCFPNDPFRPLVTLLEYRGLLTGRIREEFSHGAEYWDLERKLCYALTNNEEIHVEDVMKAIHLKSFDYRVLNLLLYQLRGEKVEELHMEFLSVSEFLVEVSDDLHNFGSWYDYEDDVLDNSFNILRMFVKIYGASTAPAMLAKCIGDAEDKYDSLLKSLDPQLSQMYQQRCEEATKEGGKVSGHPFGTWRMPTVIVDEELYRSKFKPH